LKGKNRKTNGKRMVDKFEKPGKKVFGFFQNQFENKITKMNLIFCFTI